MTRTNAEQILQALVEIPSVSSDRTANEAALDHIGDFLKQHGMHVTRQTYMETIGNDEQPQSYGTLVATTTPTKRPKVMLSAHVDVVPAPDHMFKLRWSGDNLLGRGVSDMKGSIANYMDLVRQLDGKGTLKDYDFGITIVTNEEIAGRGVESLLNDGYVPEIAILPDNAGDWNIERIAKGAWTVTLTAPGVAAHGSRPWNGDSASFKLLAAIEEIKQLFDGQGPETDTLNISRLSAGTAQNMVPDQAQATLDIRVMGKASLERLRAEVARICKKYGITCEVIGYFPSLEHDMSNEYIQEFRRSIRSVTGKTPSEVISCGACDAAYYDKRGCITIVTRPPGGGEHGLDEWLSRKGFLQLTAVLDHFIKKVCKIS